MRRLGYLVAGIGAAAVWLGFLEGIGWHELGGIGRVVGLLTCAGGLTLILWAGFLTNEPLARGFLVAGLSFMSDAGLIWYSTPRLFGAVSDHDRATLASLMATAVCIFFGMALLIAAGLAAAFAQGKGRLE